jgi:hypothetical protein
MTLSTIMTLSYNNNMLPTKKTEQEDSSKHPTIASSMVDITGILKNNPTIAYPDKPEYDENGNRVLRKFPGRNGELITEMDHEDNDKKLITG